MYGQWPETKKVTFHAPINGDRCRGGSLPYNSNLPRAGQVFPSANWYWRISYTFSRTGWVMHATGGGLQCFSLPMTLSECGLGVGYVAVNGLVHNR
jgi:hypothetical protein